MLCTICKRMRKIKETNLQIPRPEEEEQGDVLRHQSKDPHASCGGALGAVDGCALMKDATCGGPTKEPGGNKQEQWAPEGLHLTEWTHPGVVLKNCSPWEGPILEADQGQYLWEWHHAGAEEYRVRQKEWQGWNVIDWPQPSIPHPHDEQSGRRQKSQERKVEPV